MPNSGSPIDEIQVGDRVAFMLSNSNPVDGTSEKVLALFDTHDGHTMADVEWDTLGPPRRLSVENLIKI
jgi:hypothetical protein